MFAELSKIPSLRDLQYGQSLDYPAVAVKIDREKAGLSGVTAADVARSLVSATSSSRFVEPIFWADPSTGIGYYTQVEVPPYRMNSPSEIGMVPIQGKAGGELLVRDVAEVREGTMPGEYDRYNMRRLVTITANIEGEDLGRVIRRVKQALRTGRRAAPRRGGRHPRPGRADGADVPRPDGGPGPGDGGHRPAADGLFPVAAAGGDLGLGDPGGDRRSRRCSGADRNHPESSIVHGHDHGHRRRDGQRHLAPDVRRARAAGTGMSAPEAAVEGAQSRLRPILMTSFAMLAGMVPMALALGEGGEQTAPLGRAVIGGLGAATLATLVVLPSVFALVQGRASTLSSSLHPDDPESRLFDGNKEHESQEQDP